MLPQIMPLPWVGVFFILFFTYFVIYTYLHIFSFSLMNFSGKVVKEDFFLISW